MSTTHKKGHRFNLQRIARQAMLEKGFLPDFSAEVITQLNGIQEGTTLVSEARNLRHLLWCSIDNDDSNDLDQLTVAAAMPDNGIIKILVAIADVDAYVTKSSAIDSHAQHNTTSIYTPAVIFPMLPEQLSTDRTSLNYGVDRLAIVVEMLIAEDGSLQGSDIYQAIVRNQAKLAYNSLADWLEGNGPMPEAVSAVDGLADNLLLQNRAAQRMRELRHLHGALDFETIEARPVFEKDEIKDLAEEKRNSAKNIIEDFMIAANGVTARFLTSHSFPSLRRVVRTPKRWDRIVELAQEHGFVLPKNPNSKALNEFLSAAKAADPLRFPDLSLSVIKLLGFGEYVVELPGDNSGGHFGLAVKDYAHSTAPNRRYPDLITQRLLKAAISDWPIPYGNDELAVLAKHCTERENAAKKVERQVEKSAAALLLQSRVGEVFDAFVTGAAEKGTWVRLLHPPVEGRLTGGFAGVDVGQRLRVQLIHTDIEKGHIDFKTVSR